MRLGGATAIHDCSFLSNSATSRGLAVAVVASANITSSSFDRNELYCETGFYREDSEEVKTNGRYVSTPHTGSRSIWQQFQFSLTVRLVLSSYALCMFI